MTNKENSNISPFIKWLPGGDTSDFSTDRASGSTSQAANIMEAVNCGAKLLLIDEDRSATNFMMRDNMMKELIGVSAQAVCKWEQNICCPDIVFLPQLAKILGCTTDDFFSSL